MTTEPIYLDVGGQIFKTSRQTLLFSPYFQGIERLNGEISGTAEKPYFIDRDPVIFRHILNLLRDPSYNFPTKYLPELAFWGFNLAEITDRGQAEKEVLNDNNPNSPFVQEHIKEPSSDRHLIGVSFATPYISYHQKAYKPATFYSNPLNRRSFEKLPWSLDIDNDILENYYLLIPRSIAPADLLKFEVEVKIAPIYSNRIHLHQFLVGQGDKDTPLSFTVDGFHYIPINLLISNHTHIFPLLRFPERKITITLRHSELITLSTAICYYTPILGVDERRVMAQQHPVDLFFQECLEIRLSGDQVKLPAGFLRYLMWKTNKTVNQVSLISEKDTTDLQTRAKTKTNSVYTLKRGDFQYLERLKVDQKPFPETWGAMYFCKFPFDLTGNSGGIDLDESFSLKFSKSVSGYLWVYTAQVWRISGENITIEK